MDQHLIQKECLCYYLLYTTNLSNWTISLLEEPMGGEGENKTSRDKLIFSLFISDKKHFFLQNGLRRTSDCNNTLMKQSRTVSSNSVTFPTFPQIVAWTDGYMVCDNKMTALLWVGLWWEQLVQAQSFKGLSRLFFSNTLKSQRTTFALTNT